MNGEIKTENSNNTPSSGGISSYFAGFALSLILTFTAFLLVVYKVFPAQLLVTSVMAIAVAQLYFQLTLFLHVNKESKPRWNLFILIMTISFIVVIVLGSLWIMGNLDSRHSTSQGVDSILEREGYSK